MSNTAYQHLEHQLQDAGITLNITRKRVKNINFRIKPNRLDVSAPHQVSDKNLIDAISERMDWAVRKHADILERHKSKHSDKDKIDASDIRLWGIPLPSTSTENINNNQLIEWYRMELMSIMPDLFAKWQPIVGKTANETRVKKMKTRWGSCNTKAKRIWLSVYLPVYPTECTEYVIVHELCHLHHANHSAEFWGEVERAMPDYKRWHDMLAGKSGSVD